MKYKVLNKKNGQLLLSFICYDKKVEKQFVKQFMKLKKVLDLVVEK